MASFNLTAELNLRGPSNLNQVVSNIRRQLSTISLNLNINPATSRGIQSVTAEVKNLSAALRDAQTNAVALSTTLRGLGASVSSFASSTSTISSNFGSISGSASGTTTAIKAVSSEMTEFGKQSALAIRRFAAFSVATGAIYSLSRAISSAYGEFVTFNKEFIRLQQVTESSASTLSSLSNEITRLSTSFGVSSSELLQVSVTLAQAGLSAGETKTALEALAKSALAPSFDSLNDTVEGSIALMRQFGISSADLESSLGSVNAVAAKFAVEAGDIIAAIQRTGGVFAAASKGVSEGKDALNEFLAVFTSVRATTRESAETIATGLRTIFTRIQRGSTIEALKQYGVTLTDLEGKFVGPFEAVKRLSEGLKGLDTRDLRYSKIIEELGGFRQIGKVIPLIQQFETAQKALGVAQAGTGSLARDAATAQEALSVRINKVREQFVGLIRDIGQSQGFQTFVDVSLKLAGALISVADAAKDVLPAIAAIAAIRGVGALGQFFGGFSSGVGNRRPKGFAKGGVVPGSGRGDKVPALLEPGEVVMSNVAVNRYGRGNLVRMNQYARGGPVKASQLKSVKIKNRVKSANSDIDPEEFRSGNYITDSDLIYFDKTEYGVKAAKNISYAKFEDRVGEKIGGKPLYGNAPIDIPKNKLDRPIEVRNRKETTKNPELLDKLLRYNLQTTGSLISNQKQKDNNLYAGKIGVAYNTSKLQRSRFTSLNMGGEVQKFNRGGLSEDVKPKAALSPQDLIIGPGHLKSGEWRATLRSLILQNGLATDLDMRTLMVDEQKISLSQAFSPRQLASSKLQQTLGGPENIAKLEKLREDVVLAYRGKRSGVLEANRTRSPDEVSAARKDSVLFGAAGMYGNRFPPSEIRFGQTEGLKQDTKAIVFGSLLDKNVEAKQKRLQKRKIMLDAAGVPGGVDAGSREIQAAPTSRGLSKIFGSKGVSKANKALALDRVGAIAKTLSPQTQGSQIFLDFDRTLAFGSDKIGPKLNKKAPDYSAFGDPKQVSGGLAKAKLSGLGIRLKKLVSNLDSKSSGLGNELLKRMFVISARPPQTMSLISKWLADKGLRIPAGNVSGVGGTGLGADGVAIAKAEKMLSMAGPGSVFIDDDPKNISTAREKGISSIQYGSSGTKKSRIQDAQQEGLQFEQFINEQLPVNLKSGILGSDKEGMDFPLGLGGSIAKYWFNDSRLANIPVDTKRTLTGPRGKIKNNILSYLKQQGYNSGGMVQKMAEGSYARGKKGAKGARGPKGFKPLGDVEYQQWANSIYNRYDKDPSLTWSSYMGIPMPPEMADYSKKISRYALESGGAGLAIGKDAKGFEVIAKFARVKAQKAISSGKLKKTQGALTFSAAGLERGPKAPAGQMEKTLAQYQQDPQYRTAMGLDSGVSGGFLKQFETLSKSKNFTSPKTLLDKLPGAKSKILEFRASLQQQLKTATDPKEIKSLQDQIKKSTTALDDFDSYAIGESPKNRGRASHFAWSMRQAVPDAARYNLGGSSQNNVQALLTPGEAVIDPGLAKKIGKSKLDQMNYADKNKTRGYSKGGGVSIVPGSGNGDTFGPVPLPVGSYVIRKKATEALGFNRGGQVGGIQRFGGGGGSLPARPTTSTVFNTVVPPGTVQALQEIAKALEKMGVSASESARILSQGGSISVAASEKAYQADLNRLRIAGASASDIYNAEQILADVRSKNAAKIKTENVFSGKSGSELQDIQTKAEKMRASKIENTRASYAASGLSEEEIKAKMADPFLQDKIREQSYRRAAGSPAGVGGGDIEQYVNQSMMDTSTLAQMDKQLLSQRREQLKAEASYSGASKAQQRQMMRELDARTKEEIAARRDIVNQLRKDKGLAGGFLGRQGAGLSRMAGIGQTGMALFGMGELREDAFGDGKRGRGFAKGFSNMSRGMMGAGMGLTFAGGMIGDTAGKAIGGKEGAAFSAAISAIIGPVGIGMMFGPLGAFAGLVVGATSALDAWKNSIIDANLEELKKKDEQSNVDIQDAMSNLSKASNKDASKVIQSSNSAFEAIANRQNKIQSELMTKIIPGEVGSSMPTGLKWLPKTFQALTGYRDTRGNLLNPEDQKIGEAEKELVSSAKDTNILSTLPARFEAGLAKGLSVQDIEASFGPGQLDALKKLFATAQGNPAILALLTQRELKVRKKADTSDIDRTIKRIADLSFEDKLSKPLKDREKSEGDTAQAMADATVEVNLLSLALNKIGSASRKAAASFEEVERQIATQQSVMFGGQIQGVDRSQEDVLGNLLSYSVNEIKDAVSRITTGLGYNPELSAELQDAVVSQKIIQQELPKILAEVGAREQDSFNEESGSADLIRKQLDLAFIPIQPDAVKRKNSIDEIIQNIEKRLQSKKGGITVKELAEDSTLLNTAATREADPTKDLQDSLKQSNDTIDRLRKNIDVFISELIKTSDMRIAAENQRIESANQLNAALGGELSLEDMNRSFNNTLSQLTPEIGADLKPIAGTGTSDPKVIMDRMLAQETIVREDLAKQEGMSPKDIGGDEWTKLTESIRRARLEASNLSKAHLKLQTDTITLSNALNKIAEQRQVEQSKQGSFLDFLKNVNNPEAMFEFQNEIGSFLAQMAGQGTMMGLPAAIAGLERKLAVVTKPEGDKIREQFLTEAANMLKQQRDATGQPRFDQGTIDGILEDIGVGPRENPEMQRLIDEFNSSNSIYIEAMKQSSDLTRSAAQEAAKTLVEGAKEVVAIQRSAAQEPASKRIPLVPQGGGFPGAEEFQKGGPVYASGGKYINYQPRGTDTVPAMLSPGEFVVNARATKNNMSLLKSINNGSSSRGYSRGGVVYLQGGGLADLRAKYPKLTDEELQDMLVMNRGEELAGQLGWSIDDSRVVTGTGPLGGAYVIGQFEGYERGEESGDIRDLSFADRRIFEEYQVKKLQEIEAKERLDKDIAFKNERDISKQQDKARREKELRDVMAKNRAETDAERASEQKKKQQFLENYRLETELKEQQRKEERTKSAAAEKEKAKTEREKTISERRKKEATDLAINNFGSHSTQSSPEEGSPTPENILRNDTDKFYNQLNNPSLVKTETDRLAARLRDSISASDTTMAQYQKEIDNAGVFGYLKSWYNQGLGPNEMLLSQEKQRKAIGTNLLNDLMSGQNGSLSERIDLNNRTESGSRTLMMSSRMGNGQELFDQMMKNEEENINRTRDAVIDITTSVIPGGAAVKGVRGGVKAASVAYKAGQAARVGMKAGALSGAVAGGVRGTDANYDVSAREFRFDPAAQGKEGQVRQQTEAEGISGILSQTSKEAGVGAIAGGVLGAALPVAGSLVGRLASTKAGQAAIKLGGNALDAVTSRMPRSIKDVDDFLIRKFQKMEPQEYYRQQAAKEAVQHAKAVAEEEYVEQIATKIKNAATATAAKGATLAGKGMGGAAKIVDKGVAGASDILGKGATMASGALGKGATVAADLGKRAAGSTLMDFSQSPILHPFKTLKKIYKKLAGDDYQRQLKKTRVAQAKTAKGNTSPPGPSAPPPPGPIPPKPPGGPKPTSPKPPVGPTPPKSNQPAGGGWWQWLKGAVKPGVQPKPTVGPTMPPKPPVQPKPKVGPTPPKAAVGPVGPLNNEMLVSELSKRETDIYKLFGVNPGEHISADLVAQRTRDYSKLLHPDINPDVDTKLFGKLIEMNKISQDPEALKTMNRLLKDGYLDKTTGKTHKVDTTDILAAYRGEGKFSNSTLRGSILSKEKAAASATPAQVVKPAAQVKQVEQAVKAAEAASTKQPTATPVVPKVSPQVKAQQKMAQDNEFQKMSRSEFQASRKKVGEVFAGSMPEFRAIQKTFGNDPSEGQKQLLAELHTRMTNYKTVEGVDKKLLFGNMFTSAYKTKSSGDVSDAAFKRMQDFLDKESKKLGLKIDTNTTKPQDILKSYGSQSARLESGESLASLTRDELRELELTRPYLSSLEGETATPAMFKRKSDLKLDRLSVARKPRAAAGPPKAFGTAKVTSEALEKAKKEAEGLRFRGNVSDEAYTPYLKEWDEMMDTGIPNEYRTYGVTSRNKVNKELAKKIERPVIERMKASGRKTSGLENNLGTNDYFGDSIHDTTRRQNRSFGILEQKMNKAGDTRKMLQVYGKDPSSRGGTMLYSIPLEEAEKLGLTDKLLEKGYSRFARGGIVYASKGKLIPYQPRGTDTVPAMLTPGEFVVNARAAKNNMGLLKSINSGAKGYSKGGVAYLEGGGVADDKTLEDPSSLETLTDHQAEILSKRHEHSYLGLDGLTSLSDAQAEILGKGGNGTLSLDGLTSLSDVQAKSLIKRGGALSLNGLTSLTDAQVETFSKYPERLYLGSLSGLTDTQLESLTKGPGYKSLRFEENGLSDAQAEILSKRGGGVGLLGLTSLTDAQAEILSKGPGDLVLDSLTSLSDAQAEIFSKRAGGLSLYALTSLSDAQAEILSKMPGYLSLGGLTNLSDAQAEIFSKRAGGLNLYGLTSLTDAQAEILSKRGGGVVLNTDMRTLLDSKKAQAQQAKAKNEAPEVKAKAEAQAQGAEEKDKPQPPQPPKYEDIFPGLPKSTPTAVDQPEEDPYANMNPRQKMLAMRKAEYEASQQAKRESFRTSTGRDPATGRIGGAKVELTPEQKAQNKRRAEIRATRAALGGKKDLTPEESNRLAQADVEFQRNQTDEQFKNAQRAAALARGDSLLGELSPEQMANRSRAERLALGAIDPKQRTESQQQRYEANKSEFLNSLNPEQKANRERIERIAVAGVDEKTPEQQEKLDILRIPIDERTEEQIARLEELRLERSKLIYASKGRFVNFQPRGSDTVPAMLTPGEFVVNRRATQQNMGLLKAINKGQNVQPVALNRGGIVPTQYYSEGDVASRASGSSGGGGVSNISVDASSLDAAFSNFGTHVGSLSSIVDSFVQGSSSLDGLSQAIGSLGNLGLTEGASLMANAGTSVREATTAFSSAMTAFNTAASSLSTAIGTIPQSISLTVSGSIPITVSVQIEGGSGGSINTTEIEQSIMDKVGLAINAATQGGISIDTAIS